MSMSPIPKSRYRFNFHLFQLEGWSTVFSITALTTGLAVILTLPTAALAWGRIGHDIAGRTAAAILSKTKDNPFFRAHAFDLGYYCNVPDLIWKRPESYARERHQHFMDLEIFDRAFKAKLDQGKLQSKEEPFQLDRKTFNARFPEIKPDAGRAFWRIRELERKLAATADLLKQKELIVSERHRLQADWLVTAGAICHYVSDLSQPMHVSENYDGELTGQKGIHSFFEEVIVDQMWPSLNQAVMRDAEKIYDRDKAAMAGKSVLTLLKELSQDSLSDLETVLKSDKRVGRENLEKATEWHRPMVQKRLATGAVIVAEILRRNANWKANDEKFYLFIGEPAFIEVSD